MHATAELCIFLIKKNNTSQVLLICPYLYNRRKSWLHKKKPKDKEPYLANAVKEVITDISKYLNINENSSKDTKYKIENYIDKETEEVADELIDNNLDVIVSSKKIKKNKRRFRKK